MSLVGYIWNKWGSVPNSPGKLARPLPVCLVKSHLGAFSSSSVDWCWDNLPLHTSAQKYKCSALIFQFITYQLLICTNLSSTGGQISSLRPLSFSLLASLHGTGQLNSAGRISFIHLFYIPKHTHLVTLPKSEIAWSCWNASVCYSAAVRHRGEFVSHGQVCLNSEVPLARVGDRFCWGSTALFLYLIKFTTLT